MFKTKEEYQLFLDQAPPAKFILTRELGGSKEAKYVPIHYKEALADLIFVNWSVIDIKTQFINREVDEKYWDSEKKKKVATGNTATNAMVISTVTIAYTPNYPGAEEMTATGQGAGFLDDSANSVEYKTLATKALAVGDALEVGNAFGRNVGRKIQVGKSAHPVPDDYSLRREIIEKMQLTKKEE